MDRLIGAMYGSAIICFILAFIAGVIYMSIVTFGFWLIPMTIVFLAVAAIIYAADP